MPNEPRRHHYVPRMYLQNFADDEGMLTIVDRRWGGLSRKSPAAVFWTRDYYRIEGGQDVEPTAAETEFARLENEAAPVLREILSAGVLPEPSSQSFAVLMLFVALQAMRGPHARRRLTEPHRMLRRQLAHGEALHEAFGPPGPSGRVEALRRLVEREHTTEDHLNAMQAAVRAILPALGPRQWTLLRAGDGTALVTSDAPVVLEWSDPRDGARFFGPGFGLPGTYVALPLSPDVLLYGPVEGAPPLGAVLPPDKVAVANFLTLQHAVRFAASRTERIDWRKNAEMLGGTPELRQLWREHPPSPEEDLDAPESTNPEDASNP